MKMAGWLRGRVVLASGNAGKLREFEQLLTGWRITLIAQSALGIEPPVEDGASFVENALIKARHASAGSGLPAIADDSGLAVDCLQGEPGIHSARYAGADASDTENVELLLGRLHGIPARKTDFLNGEVLKRGRRVSVTFRTVILENLSPDS